MPVLKRSLWIGLGLVFAMNGVAHAQGNRAAAPGQQKKQPVVILSATVDRANETLTLRGSGFGTQAPSVLLETFPLTVLSASDTEVVTYLPATVPEGTYLFTVTREEATEPVDSGVFGAAIVKPIKVVGPQGEKGDTGDVGPVGPQGEMGPEGPAGPQGPQGEVGPVGPAGATGATGATGPQGPAGPQGATGPQGPAGAQGERGPQGEMGPQGATGPQGERGLQGETGAMGATGATGAQGPAGPQGETGATGAAGPQGVAGPAGAQGPAGPQGFQGPAGPQGPAGVSGYEIVSALAPVSPFGVNGQGMVSGMAICPTGKRVISGGYEATFTGSGHLLANSSFPISETTWKVVLRNPTITAISNVKVNVYAICVAQ